MSLRKYAQINPDYWMRNGDNALSPIGHHKTEKNMQPAIDYCLDHCKRKTCDTRLTGCAYNPHILRQQRKSRAKKSKEAV